MNEQNLEQKIQTMDDLPQVPESYDPNDEPIQNHEPVEEAPEQAQAMPAKTTSKEENLARLRQQKEKAERERDELVAHFKKLQEQQQPTNKQDDEPELGPDDLVEWKYVQKKLKGIEDKIAQQYAQQEQYSAEARLKSQYPDFDKVVTQENIEMLRDQFPELAATISRSSSDTYSKAASAYTMIKRLGIAPDETLEQSRTTATNNAHKPRPLSSMSPQQGNSPLTKANAFANGLTDELKSSLWKEMKEARKNI